MNFIAQISSFLADVLSLPTRREARLYPLLKNSVRYWEVSPFVDLASLGGDGLAWPSSWARLWKWFQLPLYFQPSQFLPLSRSFSCRYSDQVQSLVSSFESAGPAFRSPWTALVDSSLLFLLPYLRSESSVLCSFRSHHYHSTLISLNLLFLFWYHSCLLWILLLWHILLWCKN